MKATAIIDPFIASLAPSLRLAIPNPQCRCDSQTDRDGNVIDTACTCWALVDGNPVEIVAGVGVTSEDYNVAVEELRKRLADFRDMAVTNIQVPVHLAINAWRSANAKAISLSWDTGVQRSNVAGSAQSDHVDRNGGDKQALADGQDTCIATAGSGGG